MKFKAKCIKQDKSVLFVVFSKVQLTKDMSLRKLVTTCIRVSAHRSPPPTKQQQQATTRQSRGAENEPSSRCPPRTECQAGAAGKSQQEGPSGGAWC